jgi:oligopeptidase B
MKPPVAAQKPHVHRMHSDERPDPYYWMRDRQDPEVMAYLEAENAYTESMMEHCAALRTTLYEEMLSRIQETDLSVPYRKGDYYYYSRTETGKAYAIHCRKQGSLDAPEEILLDENELAADQDYFDLGAFAISPDHQILAYSVDTTGAEMFTLYFMDLRSRSLSPESIPDTYYSLTWANDCQTVFYTKVDEANRPFKLFRHRLGTDADADTLIYHELDEAYFLSVGKTRSEAYLLMNLSSQITSEVRFLDANRSDGEFQIFSPRVTGVEYDIEHHTDSFYIQTNASAINFKLLKTPVDAIAPEHWKMVLPHRTDVMLEGVSAFANHLVIYERIAGLPQVRVRQLTDGAEHYISFPEPTYEIGEGTNPDFQTDILRFTYTSLITPPSVFDYGLTTKERTLLKETPVLGGYDRADYVTERLQAIATDGTAIPLSIVYKQGIAANGQNPLLLVGYGSYGYSYPDSFSTSRLALLDRGVVMAIAHVRGGAELGRGWYEAGKFLKKQNTFTDFVTCAEHLIEQNWTSPHHLAISGGSAGGLLMGAVLNLRPDLFKVAIAQVPFVDVVTTILDPSLPLTVIEWEEWGNPNEQDFYDYMKAYSPYDNVAAQDYPALLVTAGLNDPRVSYWEPAKWTARLRALKTDSNVLLLKTNMEAGHAGASGRYDRLKEIAFEYAFLLDQWDLV